MKNIFKILLVVILIVVGFIIGRTLSIEQSLIKISAQMNRALPRIIDDNMRLVSTKVEGKVFTYIYNIISAIDLKVAKQDALKFICTDKFSLIALSHNASFVFQYYSKNGMAAAGYQISIKDCK